jgi:hypothetical protein
VLVGNPRKLPERKKWVSGTPESFGNKKSRFLEHLKTLGTEKGGFWKARKLRKLKRVGFGNAPKAF